MAWQHGRRGMGYPTRQAGQQGGPVRCASVVVTPVGGRVLGRVARASRGRAGAWPGQHDKGIPPHYLPHHIEHEHGQHGRRGHRLPYQAGQEGSRGGGGSHKECPAPCSGPAAAPLPLGAGRRGRERGGGPPRQGRAHTASACPSARPQEPLYGTIKFLEDGSRRVMAFGKARVYQVQFFDLYYLLSSKILLTSFLWINQVREILTPLILPSRNQRRIVEPGSPKSSATCSGLSMTAPPDSSPFFARKNRP